MKIFIVLSSLLVATFALDKEFVEKLVEELRTVGEKCVGETGASKNDIAALLAHRIPESHEGKCMIFCFHKHYRIQRDDGSVDPEGTVNALQRLKDHDAETYDKVLSLFKSCGDNTATDSDPCIYATSLAQCAIKGAREIGLSELIIIE